MIDYSQIAEEYIQTKTVGSKTFIRLFIHIVSVRNTPIRYWFDVYNEIKQDLLPEDATDTTKNTYTSDIRQLIKYADNYYKQNYIAFMRAGPHRNSKCKMKIWDTEYQMKQHE